MSPGAGAGAGGDIAIKYIRISDTARYICGERAGEREGKNKQWMAKMSRWWTRP